MLGTEAASYENEKHNVEAVEAASSRKSDLQQNFSSQTWH